MPYADYQQHLQRNREYRQTPEGKASISYVQRKLQIGYNRAACLLEAMEVAGIVSPMNSAGARDVLVKGGAA